MSIRNYLPVTLLFLFILPGTKIAQNKPNYGNRNYYCISPLDAAHVNANGRINFYIKDYDLPDLSKFEFYVTENGQLPANMEGNFLTYDKTLAEGGVMIGISWTRNRTFFFREAIKFAGSQMIKLYINLNLGDIKESKGPIIIVSSLGGSAKEIEADCLKLIQQPVPESLNSSNDPNLVMRIKSLKKIRTELNMTRTMTN